MGDGESDDFVGREREMDVLVGGLNEAASGGRRLILVAGEPGIGKTRLTDEFAARAKAKGATVLSGRCWEVGGAPAYWPWTQSIRALAHDLDDAELERAVGSVRSRVHLAPLLHDLDDRLPGPIGTSSASAEVARFELFEAVSHFLERAAEVRPLVLILEDIHAADGSSLLLLRFLAGQVGESRVVIVATYRDTELTSENPLTKALPDIARSPGTSRVSLSGLSKPDVARFLRTITGQQLTAESVNYLHRETEGNPLFVREFVTLLVAEGHTLEPPPDRPTSLPAGVREVIGRRLDRLGSDCRPLLRAAAVVGREFSVQVLDKVVGRSAQVLMDQILDAITSRLVEPVADAPGVFRFSHALVRDTLYDELMPAERVQLHDRVGAALEGLCAADPDPFLAELAHHFFAATPGTDPQKAVRYAIAGGQRAVRLLAFEEAVRLFRMALIALRDSPEERRRAEVLVLLGDSLGRSGDLAASKEAFLAASEIAIRADEPKLLARAAFGYAGRFHWVRAGLDRHLIPLLRQALDALSPEDSTVRVHLLGRLAGALRDQPSMEPRAKVAAEAVAMARRIGEPETLAYALLAEAWAGPAIGPDGVSNQRQLADELETLVEEVGDRERLVDVHVFRFVGSLIRGEAWEARTQLEQTDRLADELRQPSQRWMAGLLAQVLALQDGRFEDAERLIGETLQAGSEAESAQAQAARLFGLFALRREQDRLAELDDEMHKAAAQFPGYRVIRCMFLTMLCDTGRLDEAAALFDQLAVRDFASFPKDLEWLGAMTLLSEAAVVLGDPERSRALYEKLRPYEGLVGLVGGEVSAGPVSRALGLLAVGIGDRTTAERHFERAVAQSRAMGSRPWQAWAQSDFAAMLLDRGNSDDAARAAEFLGKAAQDAAAMGMAALAARVSELEGRTQRRRAITGRRPPPGARSQGLSAREREVAALVADGLTNRQIAEKLYVSERTAETHVQNILVKLGFVTRAQVASWAVRTGVAGGESAVPPPRASVRNSREPG